MGAVLQQIPVQIHHQRVLIAALDLGRLVIFVQALPVNSSFHDSLSIILNPIPKL